MAGKPKSGKTENADEKKSNAGAKGKYREDFPMLIEAYARRGMTDKQMYESLQISHDTFYQYVQKYTEFSEALKKGREPVHIEVENALLKNALGYNYEEEHYEVSADGKIDKKKRKVIKKHVPGNLGAQIFWLINRLSDYWKQRKEEKQNDNIEEIKATIAEFAKSL
jgi:hypothetical protein